jgi:SAM-dependent methyltransferase
MMANLTTAPDRDTPEAGARRIARWSGIAARYDAYRPAAPPALLDLLTQYAGGATPARVVDIGAGTGLSTLAWVGRAAQVVGVEPNGDMRRHAETRLAALSGGQAVRFVDATAERNGLPNGCADIVTASQAFHWMEPVATLAEVARVLRPGGVFAAYDYEWPPTITPELDELFETFMAHVWEVGAVRGVKAEPPAWEKSGHLERMRQSGHFRLTKALTVHGVEAGGADRFLGLVLSNVVEMTLADDLLAAADLDVAGFERAVRAAFASRGARKLSWYISYQVRVGVR